MFFALPVLIVALQVASAAGLAWFVLGYIGGLRERIWLVAAFGTSALLANVVLHLLPEAAAQLSTTAFWGYMALGAVLGLSIQIALRAHHRLSAITSLQLGDAACNFVDGALIASAALIDAWLGLVTALIVTLHELPSELGEMGLLIANGMSNLRALAINLGISGGAAILGAVLTSYAGTSFGWEAPILTAAGSGLLLQVVAMQILPRILAAPQTGQVVGRVATMGAFSAASFSLLLFTEYMSHAGQL